MYAALALENVAIKDVLSRRISWRDSVNPQEVGRKVAGFQSVPGSVVAAESRHLRRGSPTGQS